MMFDSEFGKVLLHLNGGRIIKRESGELVFVSSAFNPLTIDQLQQVVVEMIGQQ